MVMAQISKMRSKVSNKHLLTRAGTVVKRDLGKNKHLFVPHTDVAHIHKKEQKQISLKLAKLVKEVNLIE